MNKVIRGLIKMRIFISYSYMDRNIATYMSNVLADAGHEVLAFSYDLENTNSIIDDIQFNMTNCNIFLRLLQNGI